MLKFKVFKINNLLNSMENFKEKIKKDIKVSFRKVRERYERHFNIDAIELPGSDAL